MACLWLLLMPPQLFLWIAGSAALHEIGHLLALRFFKVHPVNLRITAFGCVLLTPPLGYKAEALCALAGPAVNLLLAAACLQSTPSLSLVNLALAGFNLLPLWPLDGGRFVHALLAQLCLPDRAQLAENIICAGCLLVLWLIAGYATCVLHMGLIPVFAAATLSLRWEQEKLVAKKRG